jgi:hypothetical protein
MYDANARSRIEFADDMVRYQSGLAVTQRMAREATELGELDEKIELFSRRVTLWYK